MRVRAVGLLVLLLASLAVAAPAVPAQSTEADAARASTPDPEGDAKVYAAAGLGVPPQSAAALPQSPGVDLLELWIGGETDAEFEIGLQVKSLTSPGGDRVFRGVNFDHGGVYYRVLTWLGPDEQDDEGGRLQVFDESVHRYRNVKEVAVSSESATNTIRFTLPKALVTDAKRVPVHFGSRLDNTSAFARQTLSGIPFLPVGDPTGGLSLADRAPDAGPGTPYEFVLGKVGEGLLSLYSNDPVRVSNGESTTVVYKVELTNRGDREQAFLLETKQVRPDWDVRVPDALKVGANTTVVFPVILSVPFTHDHGVTALFELYARSATDAKTWSRVDLGIHWTETPQPAGHHPGLWFHSAPEETNDPLGVFDQVFSFRSAWMNPLEDDPEPGADDANVPAYFNDQLASFVFNPAHPPPSGTEWTTDWFLPLTPPLQIGLDFDRNGTGVLHAEVKHGLPVGSSRLDARLLYCDPAVTGAASCSTNPGSGATGWRPIAQGASASAPADQGKTILYEVSLAIDAGADLLPYAREANVGLHLVLVTDRPANTLGAGPKPELILRPLGPGEAPLTLPLIEYHDPIDQAFEAIGNLRLATLSPFERSVNPGRTALFQFQLENRGVHPDDVQLELHGEFVEWARLLGESHFRLEPGAARGVQLAVLPPADVAPESRAELFLVAQSQTDPTVVAAIRLRATVVESPEIPDEAQLLSTGGAKGTPAGDVGFFLAAVAAAFASARARRRT